LIQDDLENEWLASDRQTENLSAETDSIDGPDDEEENEGSEIDSDPVHF
jgi:hypothetical protein